MTDIQEALRKRARELIQSGELIYLIGWEETRTDNKMRTAFIDKAEDADKLVWNKYCVTSTAKYLLDDRWPKGKIGVCIRGCDSRAVNRMLADKQIKRENIYLIGLPCEGKENPVCERCAHKNPVVYDEMIGETVADKQAPERFAGVEELDKMPLEKRREYWEKQFDKCIRCYACRNICPACNCRECFADQYRTGWQGKQMNRAQNMNYGLTRAYHVGDRCIECGECERVCPMNLTITRLTGKMLKDIGDLYGDCECGLSDDQVSALGEYTLADADEFM
ncbi:MAG: 4Fe-4S dicluster domain-containing protein [Oscillospiraceae bacterium]|nr:4Fe-4S dicluster domain-containing protein [Oscillospiraceae bacterium]